MNSTIDSKKIRNGVLFFTLTALETSEVNFLLQSVLF